MKEGTSEITGIQSHFNLLEDAIGNYETRDFTDLKCWTLARTLRIEISKLTQTFPDIEKRRLSDQLIRASRSITNNIAEGFGRYHFKESIKFYFISRASLSELKDHLIVALDEEYITESDFNTIEKTRLEAAKVLSGYIRYVIEVAKSNKHDDYMG